MKNDCTLIATLPNLVNDEKVRKVLSNPWISEARFNTGVSTLMGVNEVVSFLKELSDQYGKKIWIDIKGRQLRIIRWADPQYDAIELNHEISVIYPARIYFRKGDSCKLVRVKGNKVLVDPLPREALGAGQSVNILAKDLEIDGYLTELDRQYLEACVKQGINGVMASFVENIEDLDQILSIMPNAEIVSKIESLKGVELVSKSKIGNLMAARDDLYIQTGQNYSMLNHLRTIIGADSNAICASRIFSSLENQQMVDFADFSDLTLMYNMGYRRFMLGDSTCNRYFEKAIVAWEEFVSG